MLVALVSVMIVLFLVAAVCIAVGWRTRASDAWLAVGGLAAIAWLVAALMLAVGSVRTGSGSGSGVSVGVVTNVAQQGVLWQPWEVWVVHQGEMKAEAFGVVQDDQALIDRLKADADAGRRVRLYYESSMTCWAWNQGDCDVIVKAVEEPAQ